MDKKFDNFGLKKDKIFEVSKLLYGICEAADYCDVTVDKHIVDGLQMDLVPGDAGLSVRRMSLPEPLVFTVS